MEMNAMAKKLMNEVCGRCGDEKPTNNYGVCAHCEEEIDAEYMELYNYQNMEN